MLCSTTPVGRNVNSGDILFEGLTKFKEAQNNPAKAFVRLFHSLSTLQECRQFCSWNNL